ncbi:alpha/beta hydrolase [uncultured Tateyamaria sp.]|uniref:alpha/beta fold hydrolase n=1 Tax=uncultured Tateyamaria sp. TaxID=455651 RepID=UPI002601EB29|nr:alpha/beta hydrolase [uncultured Tateyamaria sp.]
MTSKTHSTLTLLPSLWLHGAGLTDATWRDVVVDMPLAKTPNLPGTGNPARVERYADALQHLAPDGAVLVGHSLGGMVALELAARTRPAALVLIEAVPTVVDTFFGRIAGRLLPAVLRRISPGRLAGLVGLGEPEIVAKELRAQIPCWSAEAIADQMCAAAVYDGRYLLSAIAAPTLLVDGQRNRATRRGMEAFEIGIIGSELLRLDGGHNLPLEMPDALREHIDDFLKRRLN